MRESGGRLRRFKAVEIRSDEVRSLAPDHPAVIEQRTLFPSTVVAPADSPRFLVSGKNSSKLGGEVMKGPRKGWPIFQLTLEERATCPRSCVVYNSCYGNSTHLARRHDHRSEDFIPLLKAEVATVARQHPGGLLVRLHVLGDFYSVPYVQAWADLLDAWPQLHVFGYTARTEDADDHESRRIARAVRWLADEAWDRFAIRFSRAAPGRQHSVVVDSDPHLPDVIICPAQTGQTQACATCGLCWAEAARDKTIAFLRHGIRGKAAPRALPVRASRVAAERPEPKKRRLTPAEMLAIGHAVGGRTVTVAEVMAVGVRLDLNPWTVLGYVRRNDIAKFGPLGRPPKEAAPPAPISAAAIRLADFDPVVKRAIRGAAPDGRLTK